MLHKKTLISEADMTVAGVDLMSSLTTLTDSLNATTSALTDIQDNIKPHPDGISLLDVKNELLLSYLQNLSLLVLLRLRCLREDGDAEKDDAQAQQAQIIQKLAEIRVYIERGVRPLEGKLKYQIDQVLQLADNARTAEATKEKAKPIAQSDEDSEADSDDDELSDTPSQDDSDEEASDSAPVPAQVPGPRLQQQLAAKLAQQSSTSTPKPSSTRPTTKSDTSAPYRPPRHNPTAMPTTFDDRTRAPRKHHSSLLHSYIRDELSSAPAPEPSIGAQGTITSSGRSGLSVRDRERERERTEYEESHFTRLPGESKAEKRKRRKIEARTGKGREVMGGEDWSGLGGLGERVSRSISGAGGEGRGVLERREKRRRERERERGEGQRGDGRGGNEGIGGAFRRRKEVLEGREAKRRRR
jgi:U3 small nucleolar ribonucleoprotein protein LCP5